MESDARMQSVRVGTCKLNTWYDVKHVDSSIV